MELIPVWQRNSPCCSPLPAVVGRRWSPSLLDRPQNSARSRKSVPSRKYAGASARRISRCWSKPGSQWTSLAARHFGPLCLMERPNLPNSCWKKVQTSITTSRTWCSLMLPPLSPRPPAPTISLWCAGSWNRGPTSPLPTNTATGLTPWRCRTKIRSWPTT